MLSLFISAVTTAVGERQGGGGGLFGDPGAGGGGTMRDEAVGDGE